MTTLSNPKNPPIELTISSDVFRSLPTEIQRIGKALQALGKIRIVEKEEDNGQ